MRHVRHDGGFFEFSLKPFPAFRPVSAPQANGRASGVLPVVAGLRPDPEGMLPEGGFYLMRPPVSVLAVVPLGPQVPTQPGVLLFASVADESAARRPELVEGLAGMLTDLTVGDLPSVRRSFSALLRGDQRVVIRTFGADGPKEAHVFKSDGAYSIIPWADYQEEWKLRRLARLCFD